MKTTSRKSGESKMEFNHRFLPETLNTSGVVHGGFIMAYMDHVGGITAYRFAKKRVVTAAVEHMSLHAPLHAGRLLTCLTSVNRVWGSAMEVGVRGVEEDFITGEQVHVLSCYMVFVCVDKAGKPSPLPGLEPENDEDRRRMADAGRRMASSLLERKAGFARPDVLELVIEDTAGAPQEACPECAADPGFFRLSAPARPDMALPGPLHGVAALLGSFGIQGRPAATADADCLILRKEQRGAVLELLKSAGYAVRTRGA